MCALANEYIQSGHATYINNHIHLLNGQPVPFDGTQQGLKGSIDTWLTAQSMSRPTTVYGKQWATT